VDAANEPPLALEIVEGPDSGRVVPLEGMLEIGSSPDAGLRLADPHASARHARITPSGGGALVEDLGDPGGTFVNDSEVAAPTRIAPGDELQLGVTVLQLRTAAEIASGPSAVRPKPPPLAAQQAAPAYVPTGVVEQDPSLEEVDELLDARVRSKARTAPLALFVLVVFAVLIFLATAKL
jgi:pSer/pThr/pTyr-binding forkhead associated (FHA) protein